jgi:uncharacterized protein (TIGR03083 family)
MAIDHVAGIRLNVSALAAAAQSAPLDTPVPSCPGWDLSRLLGHLGRVHRWSARAVLGGGQPAGTEGLPKPPAEADELLAWFEAGAAELISALESVDPAAPAWNFAGGEPVAGFWARRQATETLVHRWDAEHAVGAVTPIEPESAADGVDEYLTVLAPFILGGKDGIDVGGSIHLHATDADGEWNLHTDDGLYRVDRSHAKGDVAVRGPAGQLLLLVFQRIGPGAEGLETFGDAAVLERWFALGTL